MRFLLCFLVIYLTYITFTSANYHKPKRHHHGHMTRIDRTVYNGATAEPTPAKKLEELPKSWDWCNVDGKSYCTASWNQHIPRYCGSCYVHGALSQVNDRLKIASGGANDVLLARQAFINCARFHGLGEGCNGGEGFDVFEYMFRYGLPDESCAAYRAEDAESCGAQQVCQNCMPIGEDIFPYKCWAVKEPILYKVKQYGKVAGEAAIMSEIMARGPVTCGFASTDQFDYEYRGGVFIDRTNATDMNHDVEVVGWGETPDGVKYWKARNSWGTYWGENSFFKVVRGVNNMRFEEECTFAIVDDSNLQAVQNHQFGGSMYGIVPMGRDAKNLVEFTADRIMTELSEIADDAKKHAQEHKDKDGNLPPYGEFYKQYVNQFAAVKGADGKSAPAGGAAKTEADYAAEYKKMGDSFKEQYAPAGKSQAEIDAMYKEKYAPGASEAEISQYFKDKFAPGKTEAETDAMYKAKYAPKAAVDATEAESQMKINEFFKNQFAPAGAGADSQAAINDEYKKQFAPGATQAETKEYYKQMYAPKGTQAEINAKFAKAYGGMAASDRAAVSAESKNLNPDTADGDQYMSKYAGKWAGGSGGDAAAGGMDWHKYAGSYGGDFMKYAGGEAGPVADDADAHPHSAHHKPKRHAHGARRRDRAQSSEADSVRAGGQATTSHINAGANAAAMWNPQSGTKDTYGYAKWSNAFVGEATSGGKGGDYSKYMKGGAGAGAGADAGAGAGAGAGDWQKYAKQGQAYYKGAALVDSSLGSEAGQPGAEPVVNQEIYDAILNAYHAQRTALSRDGNQIARDVSTENEKIQSAIKNALAKGGESAREIKSTILRAIEEIRNEAAAEAQKLDEEDAARKYGNEALDRFQEVKSQVAEAIRHVKEEERLKAVERQEKQPQAAIEISSKLLHSAAVDVNYLSVVSGMLLGGLVTAAVIFGVARHKRNEGYEEL